MSCSILGEICTQTFIILYNNSFCHKYIGQFRREKLGNFTEF